MISTRGRYALSVMIDLAEHQTDGYIPLKEIAERHELSEKYLENILKTLVQNKL
ncbi:MAG: Rrf2 family transcriptional regulator, partial [Oscillospiraceae bacterium]|nr:Rrf2 family transcriptional regulator [Oscillospiraceae bacterium]